MSVIVTRPPPHINSDTVLWHYMRIEHFKALLRQRALYFLPVGQFKDPDEGRLTAADRALEQSLPEERRIYGEPRDMVRRFTGASCWTVSEVESSRMWKGSVHEAPRDVAVRSTWTRLYNAIRSEDQIDMRIVEYGDESADDRRVSNTLEPLFYKGEKYCEESELRLTGFFLHKGVFEAPPPYPPSHLVAVNLDRLVDRIVISPTATSERAGRVREAVATHCPELVGRIMPSSLRCQG